MEELVKLFEERVFLGSPCGCHYWIGAVTSQGYGLMYVNEGERRRQKNAHRISYEIYKGDIPKGMIVCHQCDNRLCVNPYHLFAGTPKDNTQDMVKKLRGTHGEKSTSAKLTNRDVLLIREHYKVGVLQSELAKRFNVLPNCISRIVNNKRWKHLQPSIEIV